MDDMVKGWETASADALLTTGAILFPVFEGFLCVSLHSFKSFA